MTTALKDLVRDDVSSRRAELVDLSHRVHAHPELCFEEERAAAWAAEALSDGGFAVEAGVCDLPTAFVAAVGTGPLAIAVCAEYDALPEIGHACGHNIICAAAVGAGLSLVDLVDDLGITLKVIGTPAEEGGGGKVLMLERGGFAGVHGAMMVHPAPFDIEWMPCNAMAHVDVHYHGREAHAAAFPEMGLNAADALTVAQVGIGLLRQHIGSAERIHGIVTDGGSAPNVVPGHAAGKWFIRSPDLGRLELLEERVRRCFEAGGIATGCTTEIIDASPRYSEFVEAPDLRAPYRANAEALGREFPDLAEYLEKIPGSTDMANVSREIPSIHPMIGLDCYPATNHQPDFTAAAITPAADQAVVDGAIGLAQTCIDWALTPGLRDRLLPPG
ncbi:MAG TPA: M20 family metallopeptidase [Iamia sp.]|nr:M20 family metallopeptidase [Iamia sp.]